MAIPDFVAQNDSNFVSIRYYTAQDPYFYTVDNRPLQDIETNLKSIRSGGADAARRAAIVGSLNLSAVLSDLYSVPSSSAAVRSMTGLAVSVPTTNTVRISAGAVYEARQISTSLTDTVMKLALITKSSDFALTAPVTAGTSIVYTIEGQFVELTSATMTVSQLPYMDSTNTFLPSTLMHGELQLTLNSGTAAATGSQAAPGTTPGKFPLYNITLTQGVTNPLISAHASAPYSKGLNIVPAMGALSSGSATLTTTNDMAVATCADAATSGVSLLIAGHISTLNPFKPINAKVTFSSSAAGGNVAFRLRYGAYGNGDSVAGATISSSVVAVASAAGANQMQTAVLNGISVPSTLFTGLSSGNWVVTKDKLSVVLERVGADGTDTNTGTVSIFQVTLFQ